METENVEIIKAMVRNGIGISIIRNPATGDIPVTSLFEGSPAYRAGIRRGADPDQVVSAGPSARQ